MSLRDWIVTIFFMAGVLTIPIEWVLMKWEDKHKPGREEQLQELRRILKEYESAEHC